MYFPHCRRFHALVVVLVVSWLDLAVGKCFDVLSATLGNHSVQR